MFDPARAATNFVVFRAAADRAALLAGLEARGVLIAAYPHGTIRAVTHYGITAADIDAVIAATRLVLAEITPAPAAAPA